MNAGQIILWSPIWTWLHVWSGLEQLIWTGMVGADTSLSPPSCVPATLRHHHTAPHHKKVHNSPRPALRPPAGQTCWVLEKWIVWSLLFFRQHHFYRLQPRARFYGNWAGQGPVSGWWYVCNAIVGPLQLYRRPGGRGRAHLAQRQ